MTGRRYELVHTTTYRYPGPVTTSYGRALLLPRDLPDQRRHTAAVTVDPAPADAAEHRDWFGNTSSYFAVTTPHTTLTVTAAATLTVTRRRAEAATLPGLAWEAVARLVADGGTGPDGVPLVDRREAVLPSRHVLPSDPVRAWAAASFTPGRAYPEVLADLAHRIRTELTYRSGSTTIATTQAELLDSRAGVCQDFAHLMLAALRAHGLPARYTSGYVETLPPPGRPKIRGADASHAWVSAWVPGAGWVEVDPTNDQFVGDRYVVLGWGRDYGDVPPLRGVIFTEGGGARPEVSVDLHPLDADPGASSDPAAVPRP
ncbi:transglutaminase family protein [Cellulomonas endometrii]|uniref:transglutaminase family protein n=1 Tax=Cellulomonas endometrii TaxID=3036301 RepID=UPI0024ADA230|nr:transglutaminase family protein [Cellulomonas endometrii]